VDDVIRQALVRPPEAIEWAEPPEPAVAAASDGTTTAPLPH
jgi:ATP-dependent Lon protease